MSESYMDTFYWGNNDTPCAHRLSLVITGPVRRGDFTLSTAETSSTRSCICLWMIRMKESKKETAGRKRRQTLMLYGGNSFSILPVFSCPTLCRIHCPPGGSEACVHHLVVGGEADVKHVSITHQVCGRYMAAVGAWGEHGFYITVYIHINIMPSGVLFVALLHKNIFLLLFIDLFRVPWTFALPPAKKLCKAK